MPRPFTVIGLTVFFACALLYDKSSKVIVICLAVFTIALAVCFFMKKLRNNRVLQAALISCCVSCILLFGYNTFYYEPVVSLCSHECEISAVISEKYEEKHGSHYYIIKVNSVNNEKADFNARLKLNKPLDANAFDVLEAKVRFFSIGSLSEESAAYYKAQNVFIGASPEGKVSCQASQGMAVRKLIHSVRQFIDGSITRSIPGDKGALTLSLILGRSDKLSQKSYNSLKNIGATHIICVSGFHLSLWCGLLLFVFQKAKIKRKAAVALTIPFVLVFMLISGMTYSVLRAGIMTIVTLCGVIISRRADSLNSLGMALTGLCCINPFSAGNVGFQLSCLSTLGMIVLSQYFLQKNEKEKPANGAVKPIIQKVKNSFLTTCFAILFTVPVTMSVFGTVNLTAFISNIPVILLAQVCMISGIAGTFLNIFLPVKYNIAMFLSNVSARVVLKIAYCLEKPGFLLLRVNEKDSALILCAFFLLLSLGLVLVYKNKKMLKMTVAVSFVFLLICNLGCRIISDSYTTLRVLNIGNGTAVLLNKNSHGLLIGCGGDTAFSGMNEVNAVSESGIRELSLILPDDSPACCSNLKTVLSETESGIVIADSVPHGYEVLIKERDKLPFSQGRQINGFFVISFRDSAGRTAVFVDNSDISALIIPDYMFDVSALPDSAKAAAVLICRVDCPRILSMNNLSLVAFQADNKRAGALYSELNGNVPFAVTGVSGDIIITASDGNISVDGG
ncbi:MAG: ComEC/Rec2 family competence protein [Clostridiales bacterium]|nr:ComEC/Rec2 family competence protein [Clostridiales bacterium]